jgi:hypothetical protein
MLYLSTAFLPPIYLGSNFAGKGHYLDVEFPLVIEAAKAELAEFDGKGQ